MYEKLLKFITADIGELNDDELEILIYAAVKEWRTRKHIISNFHINQNKKD